MESLRKESISISNNQQKRGVVVSGIRPTGDLHIGHFEGVLRNWLTFQDTYNCFYFVADWHAMTTHPETKNMRKFSINIVKDWLAFGINPERATLFIQSQVPQHFELASLLMPLVNYGRLLRLPTYKGHVQDIAKDKKIKNAAGKLLDEKERLEVIARAELSSAFVLYPVFQAADILVYNATHVPVGADQVPHIELTRELAQRFNKVYQEIFVVPEAVLTEASKIMGTDGRKMSKSYGNLICPIDYGETLTQKLSPMATVRPKLSDNGNPEECSVFDLHHVYSDEKGQHEIRFGCETATISCFSCKASLSDRISQAYQEYRERRNTISDQYVLDVLDHGKKVAQTKAEQTLESVRDAMRITYKR